MGARGVMPDMRTILPLVGNPQPASRTRLVAEELAAAIAGRAGAEVLPTIDLADHAQRLFAFPEPTIERLLADVVTADLVIVASPTYKASYTGLLKAFLDRYGTRGLAGVTAVPVLTIGSPAHTLAVDFTLRPLLVELGASVPTAGLAFQAAEVDERRPVLSEWLDTQWPALGPHLTGGSQ